MKESIPSRVHPAQAAQNPRIWLGVSRGRVREEVMAMASGEVRDMLIVNYLGEFTAAATLEFL